MKQFENRSVLYQKIKNVKSRKGMKTCGTCYFLIKTIMLDSFINSEIERIKQSTLVLTAKGYKPTSVNMWNMLLFN